MANNALISINGGNDIEWADRAGGVIGGNLIIADAQSVDATRDEDARITIGSLDSIVRQGEALPDMLRTTDREQRRPQGTGKPDIGALAVSAPIEPSPDQRPETARDHTNQESNRRTRRHANRADSHQATADDDWRPLLTTHLATYLDTHGSLTVTITRMPDTPVTITAIDERERMTVSTDTMQMALPLRALDQKALLQIAEAINDDELSNAINPER